MPLLPFSRIRSRPVPNPPSVKSVLGSWAPRCVPMIKNADCSSHTLSDGTEASSLPSKNQRYSPKLPQSAEAVPLPQIGFNRQLEATAPGLTYAVYPVMNGPLLEIWPAAFKDVDLAPLTLAVATVHCRPVSGEQPKSGPLGPAQLEPHARLEVAVLAQALLSSRLARPSGDRRGANHARQLVAGDGHLQVAVLDFKALWLHRLVIPPGIVPAVLAAPSGLRSSWLNSSANTSWS
jgi:hypothetical protein